MLTQIEQAMSETPTIEIIHDNVTTLPEEEYALLRRDGLGASDSSILFNVNPYRTVDDLIQEKRSTTISEEEAQIHLKEAVRKGHDLEPLILQKFTEQMSLEVLKPAAMYRITDAPYLTINFDGVSLIEQTPGSQFLIPVECKFVTPWGDKYYNRKNALYRECGTRTGLQSPEPYGDTTEQIKSYAKAIGIPPYYYTQVQQQIAGLNAPFGYLCALHDKGWELCVYMIKRNDEVISQLRWRGLRTWTKIKA